MANVIFLTGGSGFVGRNVIPKLCQSGYTVYALARSPEALEKVEAAGAKGVFGSLSNLQNARDILESCYAAIHCAAYMDFTYNYEKFYEANVRGDAELRSCCQKSRRQEIYPHQCRFRCQWKTRQKRGRMLSARTASPR